MSAFSVALNVSRSFVSMACVDLALVNSCRLRLLRSAGDSDYSNRLEGSDFECDEFDTLMAGESSLAVVGESMLSFFVYGITWDFRAVSIS